MRNIIFAYHNFCTETEGIPPIRVQLTADIL